MFPKLMTANTLYNKIQQPGDLLLLDVRNDEDFARVRIESRHTPDTLHIPYMEFVEDETRDLAVSRIPIDRLIVAVCAHGGSSELVAGILRRRGYTVANMPGGMEDWARLHVIRPVIQNEVVEIYQIERVARGCLSYAIISDGWAAIIDPSQYVEVYQGLLSAREAMPRLIIDTHAHADHISGGRGLAEATGAAYYLHPYDAIHPFDLLPASIPYEALRDGHRFALGRISLQAIHTPGHTLGHVVILGTSTGGDSYLFSGDTLFLRGVGRPDLGGRAESWAQLSHEAVFGTIGRIARADALVLPGHYADAAEADERGLFTTTLANLWRTNADLLYTDRAAFVSRAMANLPASPPEYIEIKRINIGLSQADARQRAMLEMGKNACAFSVVSREPSELALA